MSPRPVTPVGIIAQRLEDALDLLDAEERRLALDPALRDAITSAHRLASGLDPYLEACAGEESAALQALAKETASIDWSEHPGTAAPLEQEMLSGHVEGRLLQLLVRATGATRVLEIGMFTGYSALALAEALPAGGQVVACELDPFAAEVAERCFLASPAGERIEVRLGPALATLHALAGEGAVFDFVFIDADKGGYSGYLDALLELDLLSRQALVCVDNTLMQGQPWTADDPTPNGRAVADFNRAVAADPRVDQVLVPLRDGVTLIRRAAA